MTTIKATCPVCGDVDLTPMDVLVTRAPAAGWSTYSFGCPECGAAVSKGADDEVVALLLGAGVSLRVVDVPDEAMECHVGPRLGYDDLLDFVLQLGVTDFLAAAALVEAGR
jgi:predicted RNA-binding Zn-ribbon protein involved in translation (DUF1610 family)